MTPGARMHPYSVMYCTPSRDGALQPIQLYCDNKAACDIADNPVQHDRTNHVEVDKFFIKEKLDEKIVELPKIRSEDQLADILTKAVSSRVFSKFLGKLGMRDIYAPT